MHLEGLVAALALLFRDRLRVSEWVALGRGGGGSSHSLDRQSPGGAWECKAMQGGKRGAADENTKWVSIKKGSGMWSGARSRLAPGLEVECRALRGWSSVAVGAIAVEAVGSSFASA